jgi:aldose 1-epimerase
LDLGAGETRDAGPIRTDRLDARRRPSADLEVCDEACSALYDFRASRPIGNVKLDTAFTDLERDDHGRARVHLASPDGETAATFWLDEYVDGKPRYLMGFTGDPDVNRRSLGIEPMTCAPNAFQSGGGLITLGAGESFAASWGIEPS